MDDVPSGLIMFVDDDLDETRMDTVMGNRGYNILPYRKGGEAITDIRDGANYQLLITDSSLGDCEGSEVIAVSKEFNPEVPVIGISGYASSADKMGADSFFILGFTMERFLFKVNQYLNRSQ